MSRLVTPQEWQDESTCRTGNTGETIANDKCKVDPGNTKEVEDIIEMEQNDADFRSLEENSQEERRGKRESSTYEMLRNELEESRKRNEVMEQENTKLLSDLDHVVKERDFLVKALESNESKFKDSFEEDLRKLRKQINDLVEERSALLKKVGILQLHKNKPKASTKTQGTQADFTVNIVGTMDDNESVHSKMSSFSTGSRSERSAISGISMDTMGTSDTKSVRMHASKVISLARRMLGKKSKKGAVSNSPESDPNNNNLPSKLPPQSIQSIRPPMPPSPRRNRLPTKPRAKVDKPPSIPSKLPPSQKSSDKHKSKSKSKSRSKSSRKSGGGSKPLSFKETPEDMEFYLPQVNVDGSHEHTDKHSGQSNNDVRKRDPTALVNALRPWQVEFLESVHITTSTQLVFASKYKSKEIAKAMVKWRKVRQMKQMRSKACAVALHIWTRSIEAKIKSSLLERSASAELDLQEQQSQTKSVLRSGPLYGVFEQATEV